jgi:hypothetical protein
MTAGGPPLPDPAAPDYQQQLGPALLTLHSLIHHLPSTHLRLSLSPVPAKRPSQARTIRQATSRTPRCSCAAPWTPYLEHLVAEYTERFGPDSASPRDADDLVQVVRQLPDPLALEPLACSGKEAEPGANDPPGDESNPADLPAAPWTPYLEHLVAEYTERFGPDSASPRDADALALEPLACSGKEAEPGANDPPGDESNPAVLVRLLSEEAIEDLPAAPWTPYLEHLVAEYTERFGPDSARTRTSRPPSTRRQVFSSPSGATTSSENPLGTRSSRRPVDLALARKRAHAG